MKLTYLFTTLLLLIVFVIAVPAQIVLAPGQEKTFTTGPATSGSSGDNNRFGFDFFHSYNLAAKEIKALSNVSTPATIGTGEAFSIINYDFDISHSDGTLNNSVGAWISYDVSWFGTQLILGIALNNASVEIDMRLRDLTENKLIYRDIIHEQDLKTQRVKFVNLGLDYDESGSKILTFPAVLKRGHSYRLSLRLIASAQKYAVTTTELISSNYYDGSRGAVLNNLHIKVGLDEKETLQKLASIDSLKYKLENHYHVYLTGKGVGHNNTEANTTLSIFEEGNNGGTGLPVFYNHQQITVPDETDAIQQLPEDFLIMQNYPNPFNPSTKISFALPQQEFVTIKVFDILGRQVDILINELKSAGYYEINYNAEKLPSGTYFYEIRAGDFVETRKMILMK
jgi:hypothetical protein